MAKKNRKPKTYQPPAPEPEAFGTAGESRGVEVLTIGWMLTLVITVFAEIATAAGWLLARFASGEEPSPPLQAFVLVMLLTATIAGLLCLGLAPLIYRLRRLKPPRAIMIVAIIVGLAPVGFLLIFATGALGE